LVIIAINCFPKNSFYVQGTELAKSPSRCKFHRTVLQISCNRHKIKLVAWVQTKGPSSAKNNSKLRESHSVQSVILSCYSQ